MKKTLKVLSVVLILLIIISSLYAVNVNGASTDTNPVGGFISSGSVTSRDGLWKYQYGYYKLSTDEGGNKIPLFYNISAVENEHHQTYGYTKFYYVLEYLGNEENITAPEKIDGNKIIGLNLNTGKAKNVVIPRNYTIFVSCKGKNLETVTCSREYEENEIIEIYESNLFSANLKAGINTSLKKVVFPNLFPIVNMSSYSGRDYNGAFFPAVCFWNCKSLTDITFPDNITEIGMEAFEGCKSLQHIVIPEGVMYIDNGAFNDCINLETITIPSSYINETGIIPLDINNRFVTTILTTSNEEIENEINAISREYIDAPIILNPKEIIDGDVTGDTKFNIDDVTTVQLTLAEKWPLDLSAKGDFNKDGQFNIKDGLCMQLALVNKYTPPKE